MELTFDGLATLIVTVIVYVVDTANRYAPNIVAEIVADIVGFEPVVIAFRNSPSPGNAHMTQSANVKI